MSLFTTMQKMKFCPLCRRKWHIFEEPGKQGRAYFYCLWCEISIWVQDPMIGLWETFEAVHCFTCRSHGMRFFCRMDGYCKWLCKDCGVTIEQIDPDKHSDVIKTVDDVKAEFRALTANMSDIPENKTPGKFFKSPNET